MTIEIAQDVEQADQKYWRWSVWLDAPEEELKNVEWVLWKLDPSFSPSQVRVDNRSDGFRLRDSGWGEFEIEAEIHRRDGVTSLRHRLQFEDTPPRQPDTPPHQPKLFISYRQADARLARSLTDILKKQHKFTVFLDIDIPPGEDVRRWIDEKLQESDALIALLPLSQVEGPLDSALRWLIDRRLAENGIIILVSSSENLEYRGVPVIQRRADTSAAEIAGKIKWICRSRFR